MKQIQDIRQLLNSKKYIIMVFAALVFVSCILFMSDIFSYSRSSETAGNKLTVSKGAVELLEPDWETTGQYKAQYTEPGMLIDKDPLGKNIGNVDLYIRLKMTIKVDTLENCRLENPPSYSERIDAIANELRLNTKDANNNYLSLLYKDENDELKSRNSSFVLGEIVNSSNEKERVYYFYYVNYRYNLIIH